MKNRNVWIYLGLFLSIGYLIYLNVTLGFGYGMMVHHPYWYLDDYTPTQYALIGIFQILAYTMIAIGSFQLIHRRVHSSRAMAILDMRLSRGELSIEEHDQIKKALQDK